jgi:hypothetical protein
MNDCYIAITTYKINIHHDFSNFNWYYLRNTLQKANKTRFLNLKQKT